MSDLKSIFEKLSGNSVVEDLGNVAIACDDQSNIWIGEIAQASIDHIESQDKKIADLQGVVDRLARSDFFPQENTGTIYEVIKRDRNARIELAAKHATERKEEDV